MQAETYRNVPDAGCRLSTKLRRAKYAEREEAVALCLLAAEELDKMSYDLRSLKLLCAGMLISGAEKGKSGGIPDNIPRAKRCGAAEVRRREEVFPS